MTGHLIQTTPGSADGGSMRSPPKPIPTDMAMMSRTNELAGMELFAASTSSNRGPLDSYGRQPRTLPSNPVETWYESNDGPWIPKGLAPAEIDEQSTSRLHGASVPGYSCTFATQYPNDFLPSECSTGPPGHAIPPSDSGYGSYVAKRSITSGSLFDESLDRTGETQSIVGNPLEFHNSASSPDMLQKHGVVRSWGQPQGQTFPERRKELICETCKKVLKTNSELKKHRQRHTKPYTCDVPGCTRIEGFSTTNDLYRHKRSVHKDEAAQGNWYRCLLDNCGSKAKIWPRADNFRAHLKRCHSQNIKSEDEGLERYAYRPSPPAPQELLHDLAGFRPPVDYNLLQFGQDMGNPFQQSCWSEAEHIPATELPREAGVDSHAFTRNSQSPLTLNPDSPEPQPPTTPSNTTLDIMDRMETCTQFAAQTSHQIENSSESVSNDKDENTGPAQFVSPRELTQSKKGTQLSIQSEQSPVLSAGDASPLQRTSQPETHLNEPQADDDRPLMSRLGKQGHYPSRKTHAPGVQSATSTTGDTSSMGSNLDGLDPAALKKIIESLHASGALEEHGYRKENSSAVRDQASETAGFTHHEQHACAKCNKNFARPCELRKHLKRHEKPYGCTFHGCSKKFGSKNDWKRHESSQHFLIEAWKCNEVSSSKLSEPCGKVNHRRESFRQHLQIHHKLQGDIVDAKIESCHVGRNCDARFWCGFCQEIVEITQKGLDAWAERFNHIDDHFFGRNKLSKKQIDDWESLDPDAPLARDGSTYESDDDVPEQTTSRNKSTSIRNIMDQGSDNHRSVVKRKMDDEDDGRHVKKTKKGARNMGHVTQCCECGEGNTRGASPRCVNTQCQHELCNYCI
ncbi:uncharacterized protein BCR38DRAFT_57368 [Pseudomassariella vexata]|uniref:C2H2-type domain-containing protein n=1 Tax=Pseudomassariella vexata TaxID=1141098 RepID=A0A1Y2DJN5_9PEZI|nr:uncharacterized protein BCR38DRAFT_57368 [Pseudomassariella vexata]ORY59452.1 hypothetical protein BCR38DRAFT_57368 [Pseudomassariella vexata]